MAALPDEFVVPVRIEPADELTARILGVSFTGAVSRRRDYPVGGPGCPGCAADREAAPSEPRAFPPLLSLPAEMHDPHYQRVARLAEEPEWTEVVPGLEACLSRSAQLRDSGGRVTVLFRLTRTGEDDAAR